MFTKNEVRVLAGAFGVAVLLTLVSLLGGGDGQAAQQQTQQTRIAPGLIIGVGVAGASAFVSHFLIRSRENERWDREVRARRESQDHERRLEEMRLEDTRQDWLRRERRQAYGKLLAMTNAVNPTEPYDFVDLTQVLSEIELVTPNPTPVTLAEDVVQRYIALRRKAETFTIAEQNPKRILSSDECTEKPIKLETSSLRLQSMI